MDRRNEGFTGTRASGPKFGLFMSTALASMALASCAASAPPAETSFAKAQSALEDGKVDRAITHAEAAVLAEPRNAGYRALLGAAYLEAGRFNSASTAFGEAIELGNTDSRTILSYALAKVATGDNNAALAKLAEFEGAIPSADLGLAMALAGQPERGVHHLINTVRNGTNNAKARQNLAYSYALAGNWRAARVMAAEDVPADQLDARLSDWAASARPEDYQVRVANLLGVTPVSDSGQPQMLALANFPSQPMLVAEAEDARADEVNADVVQVAAAEPSESEAMAFGIADIDTASADVETVDPTPVRVAAAPAPAAGPSTISRPVVQEIPGGSSASTAAPAPARVAAAPAPVSVPAAAASTGGAPRFVSNAVVQNVPAASAERPAPQRVASPAPQRRMAVATGSADTHLVQLGSFGSRAVAESKWNEFKSRFPQLAGHDVVITEALVNGRTYFRVAAAGFGRSSAARMCNAVKARGTGCFAYAAANPPAGAVDRGIRIAARTR